MTRRVISRRRFERAAVVALAGALAAAACGGTEPAGRFRFPGTRPSFQSGITDKELQRLREAQESGTPTPES